MYHFDFEHENCCNVCDGVYGVVRDNCRSGVFLELENGEMAYAPFGYLKPGQRVLCTVLRKARECMKTLVSIDSILYESEAA